MNKGLNQSYSKSLNQRTWKTCRLDGGVCVCVCVCMSVCACACVCMCVCMCVCVCGVRVCVCGMYMILVGVGGCGCVGLVCRGELIFWIYPNLMVFPNILHS